MATLYDKYFLGNDLSSAKANFVYDIKDHVLYGNDLTEIINDLERNGLLKEMPFTKKPQGEWSDHYSKFLATGFASGYFSRDYLYHCAEVAEYLYKKRQKIKILRYCGIASLVIVGAIIAFCRA